MSQANTEKRNSFTAQEVFGADKLNELMYRVRDLARHHRQFSVCFRGGNWELSYIEVIG